MSAGKVIKVRVMVDGANVGWVQYVHVNSVLPDGFTGTIPNGALLGRTKFWAYDKRCWQVSSATGVHTHMESGNISAPYKACYVSLTSGSTYPSAAAIGAIGDTGVTTAPSPCFAAALPPATWPGIGSTASFFGTDRLQSGQQLGPNQYLLSRNAQNALHLQPDGNLVLYRGGATWQSGTSGSGANRLIMQTDNNLVLYRDNTWVWQSNTSSRVGSSRLVIQDDGNFVVYRNDSGAATFQTRTVGSAGGIAYGSATLGTGRILTANRYLRSPDKRYAFLLQADGNVVLYGPGYHVLWHSNTHGTRANRLVMQTDGNLVLYNSATWAWQSNTFNRMASHADLQDDGNFVVYVNGTASYTFQTGTGGRI